MKIITIVGARPQFIKASMLSLAFKKLQQVEEIIIHTGQHFDANMSEVFFNELNIPVPKYNLEVHSLGHASMVGSMLLKIEPILGAEKPDMVIVYGDTNSTLAGALAAKKMNIPIAHIEAGLRSYNSSMPEETNRILVDRMANLLFCPTSQAEENLQNEGFKNFECEIFNFGDVMKDAALHFGIIGIKKSTIAQNLGLKSFVLATMHRAENIDNKESIAQIVEALNIIEERISVLVPLHPRAKQSIEALGMKCNFKIIEPVGYLDMLALTQQASMIITDSGGLQKEAYFFNKLCITMRNETEWTELVSQDFNKLAGCKKDKIVAAFLEFEGKTMQHENQFYGLGNASKLIAERIIAYNP
jgi:UDP-GlcNAc3NAcA epimerase